MGVNKVNLVGRLGKDPDFHYVDKTTTVSRLRVAVKDCDYDANGDKGKYTTWVNAWYGTDWHMLQRIDSTKEQLLLLKAEWSTIAMWTKMATSSICWR